MAAEDSAESLRIDRLYLKGVGPFRDLDLEFRPKVRDDLADMHILVGPNGSGKSTVLYALAGLFSPTVEDRPLVAARFRDSSSVVAARAAARAFALRAFPEPPPALWISEAEWRPTVAFGTPALRLFEGGPPWINAQVRRIERLHGNLKSERFRFAAFGYAGQRNVGSYALQSVKEPDAWPLDNALSFTSTANTATIVQWLASNHTKEALALKDGNLEAAGRYRSARLDVESALRQVTGEDIVFEMSYEPLGISVRRAGTTLNLDVLPDGYKSIVSWVADLLSRLDRIPWADDTPILQRQFLLLLDEVDIHLHPAWQRKILPMVQRLFPNAQIIVSTHSPFVVSSVADAWVYPLGVRDGAAFLREPVKSQAGTSFGAVLRTLFGVSEEFDVETEEDLGRFYTLREKVLAGDHASFSALRAMAQQLAAKGIEVADIVNSEVLQVAHRIGAAP